MKYCLLIAAIIISHCSHAQTTTPAHNDLPGMQTKIENLPFRQHNLRLSQATNAPRTAEKTTIGGPGYVFDTTRWSHLVDSTWGAGLSDSFKMSVFNTYWKLEDSAYAAFINLPAYSWDAIVANIDTQIMHGVSKGRFAALANQFMTYINDGHSLFADAVVNYPSVIYPGLPLFRGESGLFGASITTYHDTEALVYAAHSNQPLGLQPGDIILGYNDIPWTSLVKTILNNNLPNSVYKGSTMAATNHRYIQAAGENWYLFDTINIKKCDGSLVNLPTSLMNGWVYNDFCTEQMPVAGVHIPSYHDYYYSNIDISSGVMSGHRIGYVYMYDCEDGTGLKLLNAVKTLVEDSLVTGLIFDIRTNFGGGFGAYTPTFEYLNAGGTSWVGYGDRYDTNRLNLYNSGLPSWYDVTDTDAHYFQHPIAFLTGPNAVSAGDFMPILFRHDPTVKVFGKSTAGAYGSSTSVTLPSSDFYAARQEVNFFKVEAPSSYITHTEVPVDSAVWFDKDSVCAGVDNMVTTAVRWIEGITSAVQPLPHNIGINIFPNPAHNYVNIAISNVIDDVMNIKLYNMLGDVVNEQQYNLTAGSNNLKMSLQNLPPGNYYLQLQGADGNKVIRQIAILK